MSVTTLISLALALLRAFNWVSAKIDQSQWKAAGRIEALNAQRAIFDARMLAVDRAVADSDIASPEDRAGSLDRDL